MPRRHGLRKQVLEVKEGTLDLGVRKLPRLGQERGGSRERERHGHAPGDFREGPRGRSQ